jgi:hypothetical protein
MGKVVVLTPKSVTATAFAPDLQTTELVPDPLHGTSALQENTPWVGTWSRSRDSRLEGW